MCNLSLGNSIQESNQPRRGKEQLHWRNLSPVRLHSVKMRSLVLVFLRFDLIPLRSLRMDALGQHPCSRKPYERIHQQQETIASADLARGMVGQLISICWKADKCAKDWMSKTKKSNNKSENKNKNNKQKSQTNKTKRQNQPKTRKDIQQPKWNSETALQNN